MTYTEADVTDAYAHTANGILDNLNHIGLIAESAPSETRTKLLSELTAIAERLAAFPEALTLEGFDHLTFPPTGDNRS